MIEAMLPWFSSNGHTVNVVKHSHHPLELEPAHKDSARFRAAGASEVLIVSRDRYAIVRELRRAPEPEFSQLVHRLTPSDLTLVEGYSDVDMPRIEVVRPSTHCGTRHTLMPGVVAVAADSPIEAGVCTLPLNEPDKVAEFVSRYFRLG